MQQRNVGLIVVVNKPITLWFLGREPQKDYSKTQLFTCSLTSLNSPIAAIPNYHIYLVKCQTFYECENYSNYYLSMYVHMHFIV